MRQAVALCGLAAAWGLVTPVPSSRRFARVTTPHMSARVLPLAYNAGSAAIVFRAATRASSPAEVALLGATAALATVDLGPTANRQLASAKRAYAATPPASAGAPKRKRQAAKTWRAAVRAKLALQLGALAWAATHASALQAAAAVFAAQSCFWLMGAGAARHDAEGVPAPVPPGLVRTIAAVDLTLLATAALGLAAWAAPRRAAACSWVCASGMMLGVLENLPAFVARLLEVVAGLLGADAAGAAEQ